MPLVRDKDHTRGDIGRQKRPDRWPCHLGAAFFYSAAVGGLVKATAGPITDAV
jgi:hypothetical protein